MRRYSKDWAIKNGGPFNYFWKSGDQNGQLSQWYKTRFSRDGDVYYTAEHWMMAQKALLFSDKAVFEKILIEPDPAKVKSLGRLIKGFDQTVWDDNKMIIVLEGNLLKFQNNPKLIPYLNKPGLWVEASPYDPIWGIGLSKESAEASIPKLWKGENLLGEILTNLRDQLC